MRKFIFVFSGPSGVGKSTLIEFLLDNFENIKKTATCTTRPPRDYEIDGKHYNFLSQEGFEKAVKNEEFVEYVECYGNRYGTLKRSVRNILKKYDVCILDLDFAGGYKVLHDQIFDDVECVGILILPPSIKTLKNRLLNRNSESDESFNIRLNDSFRAEKIGKYKHVIINKDSDVSKNELLEIFKGYV